MKKCTKCGLTLEAGKFLKDKSKKDGLYSSCYECYRKRVGAVRRNLNEWHVGTDGYVHKGDLRQHRYIMEQHLGRKLKRNEHVHHINHDKTDNRLENLEVLSAKIHHQVHPGKGGSGKDMACTNCGKVKYYPPSALNHVSSKQYRCIDCYKNINYKRWWVGRTTN